LVEASAKPAINRRVGLQQLGLPYAQDPAVTKHLAHFLARQVGAEVGTQTAGATFLHPTALLFNGGVFKAEALQARVVEVIDRWLKSEGAPPVRVLEGGHLDLAVARGAAAYARVRAGSGIRIRGGIARSYYVGVESAMPAVPGMAPPLKAVCVAPVGMEEGSDVALAGQELGLVVGEPVQFRFFASARRPDDVVGTVLERWPEDELEEVAPIEATLPAEGAAAGEVVPVTLHAAITEVGTLALSAAPSRSPGSAQRWKLEFNVRLKADS
jgi:hypothetical protein